MFCLFLMPKRYLLTKLVAFWQLSSNCKCKQWAFSASATKNSYVENPLPWLDLFNRRKIYSKVSSQIFWSKCAPFLSLVDFYTNIWQNEDLFTILMLFYPHLIKNTFCNIIIRQLDQMHDKHIFFYVERTVHCFSIILLC